MFVIGNNALGKGGFVPPANTGDILTATGYPATLIKTLKKKIESITVYGAEGGVGGKTINLFNRKGFKISGANIKADGKIATGTGSTWEIEVEPNTAYTFVVSENIASLGGYYFSYGFSENRHTTANNDVALDAATRKSSNFFAKTRTIQVTSTANANYLYVSVGNDSSGNSHAKKLMLVEGSYTDVDAPKYEPYGYAIPITVSGNLYDINTYPLTNNKFINYTNGLFVSANAQNTYAATEKYIPCEALRGKIVTLNKRSGAGSNPGIAFYSSSKIYVSGKNGSGTAGTPISFTVPDNAYYMRFTVPYGATDIMLNYGSTVLPYYVPYMTPKTYNLYIDAVLDDGDTLTISPKAQTAVRTSGLTPVDVKGLQDWAQDWKLPKANNLMVTADTTVEPDSIEIQYWSKAKEETG